MTKSSASKSKRRGVILSYAAMTLLGLFFILPVVIMVVGSFKSDATVISDQTSLAAFDPRPVELQNYSDAAETGNYFVSLRASLIVSSVIVFAGLFVNSLCGYALARLDFRGRKILLPGILAMVIVPFEAIAIPLLLMFAKVGWTDTLRVQFLPFIAQPLFIVLFYAFFRGLPNELEEAAKIDGASAFRTFRSVVFPLAKPAYASAGILSFLFSWGQFLWPVLVTRTAENRPLPLGLTFLTGGTPPIQWGDILAFTSLMVLPVAIVFIIFQRQFVEGVSSAGLKG